MSDRKEPERTVGGSRRADGTYRKAVKVREGFLSEEIDQTTYQSEGSKKAARIKNYVPGRAPGDVKEKEKTTADKRKERRQRKKERELAEKEAAAAAPVEEVTEAVAAVTVSEAPVDKGKKLKKLNKLLRQITKIETEKKEGATLTPEQETKLGKKQATLDEIKALS